MKKILIVASDMEIGGAERALLGLLNAIDTSIYQVDLFLLRHQGPFMRLIPDGINLLPESEDYSCLGVPIGKVIRKGKLSIAIRRAIGKNRALNYISKNRLAKDNSVLLHYSFLYTKKALPQITTEEYDLALSFTIPYYLLDEKVVAKKKAVWLHTDYSVMDGDIEEERLVWSAYPYIVSISDDVTAGFLGKFPEMKERIVLIENILSKKLIKSQAEMDNVSEEMSAPENTIKLLTIGRFVHPKNFDNIPEICQMIRSHGLTVAWYLIGFGSDEELIKNKIKEYSAEEFVKILGKKDNPYPYINLCDIYVQPSRFEGKCVAVREAQLLGKTVIITNYPTASSQLENGVDGFIVPMDNVECASAIANIISDKHACKSVAEHCLNYVQSNEFEVEKIYKLMD